MLKLKQLAVKAGLTTSELNIFVFLIIMLSAGIIYKYYSSGTSDEHKTFDYSASDSLFEAADSIKPADEIEEKKFDYKQEVLDFNKQNFNKIKPVKTTAEKSINLNTAGFDELIAVPGLGEKTAEKILKYRSENGRFNNLEQLKDIKGIGIKKFNKIRNYIYIDN